MNTILSYLNNMFSQLPNTEEVKKAKEEMAAMMEDKYLELKTEGKSENEAIGIVISEFGNIDELTAELGIESKKPEVTNNGKTLRKVTIKEGKDYIDICRMVSDKIAYGTMLCIMSPIVLIVLAVMSDGNGDRAENMAALIGLVVLFVMIVPAVTLFIIYGTKLDKYEYLKTQKFQLENGGETLFRKMKEEETSGFGVRIAVGVSMCVAAVIPVIVSALLFEDRETIIALAVGLLLIIVAFATRIFITSGMPFECYNVLLQEGDYQIKQKNGLSGKIGGVYWPIVVAIYIGYSFITNDWGRSWIIWPVAGVLFAAITGICNFSSKDEE